MHVDTTDVLKKKTVPTFRIIITMNILVPLSEYATVFHSRQKNGKRENLNRSRQVEGSNGRLH